MATQALTLAELHERLKSFDAQTRAVGAGEIALVALAFSDLTSTFAADAKGWRWMIGLFVTATLLAGVCTALAWIYTHAALVQLSGPIQPLTETDARSIRTQYILIRLLGWTSIVLVLLAGVTYLTTVWIWVVVR